MQKIVFTKISEKDFQDMEAIFGILKGWKEIYYANYGREKSNEWQAEFELKVTEDTLKIIEILDTRYNAKFWNPTKAEAAEFYKGYNKLTLEEKSAKERSRPHKWNFDSWIDAIVNMEVALLDLAPDGTNYVMTVEESAWPSAGIDATQHLIDIYDGEVLQNEMIPDFDEGVRVITW
ncbi:MAG: hypothetical protein FWG66_14615 [Spirochaetes bacterium]|nr:hypothetical protein [Spirochaetota bacterium]